MSKNIIFMPEIFLALNGGRRARLTTSPPSVSRLPRENVGASTSHNPMGLHGLLQGYLYSVILKTPAFHNCYSVTAPTVRQNLVLSK
jgi:hypothetical protein